MEIEYVDRSRRKELAFVSTFDLWHTFLFTSDVLRFGISCRKNLALLQRVSSIQIRDPDHLRHAIRNCGNSDSQGSWGDQNEGTLFGAFHSIQRLSIPPLDHNSQLQYLERLKQLTSVRILSESRQWAWRELFVECLSPHWTALRHVHISHCFSTQLDLTAYKQLRSLQITTCFRCLKDLKCAPEAPLELLVLGQSRLNDKQVESLCMQYCATLQELQLVGSGDIRHLNVHNMQRLRRLDLRMCSHLEWLEYGDGCPLLGTVDVRHCHRCSESVGSLACRAMPGQKVQLLRDPSLRESFYENENEEEG